MVVQPLRPNGLPSTYSNGHDLTDVPDLRTPRSAAARRSLYLLSEHLLFAASQRPAALSQSVWFVARSHSFGACPCVFPSLPTAASGGVTSGRKSCQSSLFSCIGTITGATFCKRRGDVAKAWPTTTQAANVSTIPALMDE